MAQYKCKKKMQGQCIRANINGCKWIKIRWKEPALGKGTCIKNREQNILIVNNTTEKITSKQKELEAIRKKCRSSVLGRILNGLKMEQLDKASKYFTSLESRKYIGRQKLQVVWNDGQVISDQFENFRWNKTIHKNIQKGETIKSDILSFFS